MTETNSWGLLPYSDTKVQLASQTSPGEAFRVFQGKKFAPIGARRSYGDVGLNPGGSALSSENLDKFIAFDHVSGQLECEAGVLIREIQSTFVSRGWMSPVTPGTSFVTVAGAIANDVHGKNHHTAGSFGNHVLEIVLARSDGNVLTCSEQENKELFIATIGGLGLTGVIVSAKLQLAKVHSAWVKREKIPFQNLEQFFRLSKESESGFESSVAWFDCSTSKAGRGSFIRGNHFPTDNPDPKVPKALVDLAFTPPFSAVNRATLNTLNRTYFKLQKFTAGEKIVSMWPFYYPLDSIRNWNRAYGPKGFYQYQSVIPAQLAESVTKEMLGRISGSGLGSFLAVLKTFGGIPSKGLLSFPMEGTTLALDFPNLGEKTERLFKELDELVLDAGGRLNPSKDARMPAELFFASYPMHREFVKFRDGAISSGFSRRIFGS
jgi:FAD/FMN-containing dehydrogenase